MILYIRGFLPAKTAIMYLYTTGKTVHNRRNPGERYLWSAGDSACAVGMPSKDTIKIADKDGFIQSTPDRSQVWSIQTPQIFAYPLIRSAHESLRAKDMSGVTDDAW